MKDFIYIVLDMNKNETIVKLGYTNNSLNRLTQYFYYAPFTELIYLAEIENAKKLETIFHSQNKAFIGNEWYSIELLPKMLELLNKYDHKRLYIKSLNSKIDRISKSFRIEIDNNLTETIIGSDNSHNRDVVPNTTFKSVILGFQNNKFTEKEKLFHQEKYPYLTAAINLIGYDELKNIEYDTGKVKYILKFDKDNPTQFKDVMKEYCDLVDERNSNTENLIQERMQYLENLNKDIKNIVDTIGTGKVRTLKFSKKLIEKVVKENSFESQNTLKLELDKVFKYDVIYLSSDVKIKLQKIYNNLKMTKKANATDLGKYYKIDKKIRKINGKVCDSIVIIK